MNFKSHQEFEQFMFKMSCMLKEQGESLTFVVVDDETYMMLTNSNPREIEPVQPPQFQTVRSLVRIYSNYQYQVRKEAERLEEL